MSSRTRQDHPSLEQILAPEANSFNLVRLSMAAAVLISHGFYLNAGTTAAEPLHALTGHSLGEHAVEVFFFLSGILIAQSFDKSRSLLDFAAARVLRIFPALIVCVLLSALIAGPVLSTMSPAEYFSARDTYAYIIRTLSLSTGSAGLPGVFETVPAPGLFNISLWTLKYEVLCYAGVAAAGLAGLFCERRRKLCAFLLAAFLALVFIDEPKPIETFTTLDNIRYFALYFGMGTLAYLLRGRLIIHGGALWGLGPIFALSLGTRFVELATALFVGYATLWLAKFRFGRLRELTSRFDLSYGTYIFACPVEQILIEKASGLAPELQILLAIAIVLPLAFLSWVLIERPAIGARKPMVQSLRCLVQRPGAMQAALAQ